MRRGEKVVEELESDLKRVYHNSQKTKNPPPLFGSPVLEREIEEFACQEIITPWEKLQLLEEV